MVDQRFWLDTYNEDGQNLLEFPIRNDLGKFFKRLNDQGHKPVAIIIEVDSWTLSVLTEKIEG